MTGAREAMLIATTIGPHFTGLRPVAPGLLSKTIAAALHAIGAVRSARTATVCTGIETSKECELPLRKTPHQQFLEHPPRRGSGASGAFIPDPRLCKVIPRRG